MPKLIIIDGPMATGKSTITARLRTQLPSFAYVDRPNLKRGLQPIGRDRARELSKACAYELLRRLADMNVDIIVEEVRLAGVQKALGDALANYAVFAYRLHCTVETAMKRDFERSGKQRSDVVNEIHESAPAPTGERIIDTESLTVDEIVAVILSDVQDAVTASRIQS